MTDITPERHSNGLDDVPVDPDAPLANPTTVDASTDTSLAPTDVPLLPPLEADETVEPDPATTLVDENDDTADAGDHEGDDPTVDPAP